jgi:AcrR family transcriptional regulator
MSRAAKVLSQPRAARRAERRRTIVETAALLFAEVGYSACEMDRLASQLQVAKGTLYLYFPGKQELFFACVDHGLGGLRAATHAAAEEVDEPFAKIAAGLRAYLLYFREHPQYVELLLQERAIFKDRKRPAYFEHREAARVYWRALLESLITGGRIRPELQVESILDTIGNLFYGTMFANHFLGNVADLEDQYQRLLDIVFRGILSEKERARHAKFCSRRT